MSNMSIGRGEKGSKFWMQTLVTIGEESLLHEIRKQLPGISTITWKSPGKNDNYKESKTTDIQEIKGIDLGFWPDNGPWWDAVGISDDETVLLVEAKAHIQETKTKCNATAEDSKRLIKQSLMATHKALSTKGHKYDESLWYSKYYQLGNRLTFLKNLSNQKNVKLILLNIVDDPTHIKTSDFEWKKHYDEVFQQMLGDKSIPKDVILLNIDVG